MIWLLLIPCLALIIWGIREEEGGGLIGFGAIFSLAILITLPFVTYYNGESVQEMKMFAETNQQNYAITVNETASYLSESKYIEGLMVEGSLEKLEQAGYVSERLREWRDQIVKYNYLLADKKYLNSNIFLGILMPDEIENLQPIIIQP